MSFAWVNTASYLVFVEVVCEGINHVFACNHAITEPGWLKAYYFKLFPFYFCSLLLQKQYEFITRHVKLNQPSICIYIIIFKF